MYGINGFVSFISRYKTVMGFNRIKIVPCFGKRRLVQADYEILWKINKGLL